MPEVERSLGDVETMLRLRRVPLLAALAPEDLQRIAMVAGERRFAPGEALVREGDLGDELFVILEGGAVVHADPDGTEHLLRTYEEGDHIGELAVLRERPRAATVIADGVTVRTLVIGGEGLTAILRERPDAAMAMLATLAERISARSDEPCSPPQILRRPPSRPGRSRSCGRTSRGRWGPARPRDRMGRSQRVASGLIHGGSRATAARSCGPRATLSSPSSPRRAPRSPRRSTRSEPSPPTPGRPARRSGSGWGCTRARRTWPATTTEAWTSTGRRASRRSVTAADPGVRSHGGAHRRPPSGGDRAPRPGQPPAPRCPAPGGLRPGGRRGAFRDRLPRRSGRPRL